MNSNLFHNLVNVVTLLIALLTSILTALGCTTLPTGELECSSATWLSPTVAAGIIAFLQVLKLIVNIVRDGVTGLTKKQPPVQ